MFLLLSFLFVYIFHKNLNTLQSFPGGCKQNQTSYIYCTRIIVVLVFFQWSQHFFGIIPVAKSEAYVCLCTFN